MGLTVSAEEIIKDRMILKRESFLNLSRSSYLVSKVLLLFGLSAIQTILFAIIGTGILEIKSMTFSYWLILFSTSCFANMLGLNISSAFNSVVTIYILIPLLIIPQLILSGVVVSFDKLNGSITTRDKVPVIGEVMASRWAFEAMAVDQFVSNDYNKPLYPLERDMANAEYKSVNYIPKVLALSKSSLAYKGENKDRFEEDLATLRNEVAKELQVVGQDQFDISRITPEAYDQQVADDLASFLDALRKFYNNRRKKADEKREAYLAEMSANDEARSDYIDLKGKYNNKRISLMVKNTSVSERVVREGDELVQKVYPIYAKPTPAHALDFRTIFYYPEKHILGAYIGTKTFNVLVIWSMTLILFVTLYFDVLKKLISGRKRS